MFKSLEIFKVSHAMATHAAARQSIVAQNIANADTPGYRGRDLADFKETYAAGETSATMRATRAGHFGQPIDGRADGPHDSLFEVSPNGNAVSLEEEMLKAVDIKRQHDRALAVYKHSLTVLRTALGR